MSEKLAVGMLIDTSYGTGPYRIKKIIRGCTCPLYLDTLNRPKDAPAQPEHLHLFLTGIDGKGNFYINHFVESTLERLQKNADGTADKLRIIREKFEWPKVQLDLFE